MILFNIEGGLMVDEQVIVKKPRGKQRFGRILVVDDEQDICKMLNLMFQKEGFETEGIYFGKDLLSKIKKMRNTLLILDYTLPDMDALEIINLMEKEHCSVPFIILTGNNDINIAIEMMK